MRSGTPSRAPSATAVAAGAALAWLTTAAAATPSVAQVLSENFGGARGDCGGAAATYNGSTLVFGATSALFVYDTDTRTRRHLNLSGTAACPTARCDVNGVVVAGDVAYVAPWVATYPGYHDPGVVAAVDLATLELRGVLALGPNQGAAMGMVADADNKYAYVLGSASTTTTSPVVKVDLTTFSAVGAVDTGASMLLSAALHEDDLLLVGTADGGVVSIDLTSFAVTGSQSCSDGQLNTGLMRGDSAFFGTYGDGSWCEFDLSGHGGTAAEAGKPARRRANTTAAAAPMSATAFRLPAPRTFTAAQGRSSGLLVAGVDPSAAVVFSAADPPGLWDLRAAAQTAALAAPPDPIFGNIMSTCVLAHPHRREVYYGNPAGDLEFTVWTFNYTTG